ncbi:hypothetical protein A9Q99_23070 [Gammaproteobacteria bacterium 45_16_T64]|nr:hypothetical protein A9Q99_23070 [Gammaproteobacteria bacterium 45_16_T64]
MEYLIYPVLGVFAGLTGGLLGVGGGLVVVPVLIFTFSVLGFHDSVLTHMAVGTSLGTIILTSYGSILQHHAKGAVRWDIFVWLAIGLVCGGLLGAEIAGLLEGRVLQIVFGGFALVMAAQMGFGLKANPQRDILGKAGLIVSGTFIGAISSLFGIGGGSLTVPFLSWCNVKMQEAVGTSSAGGMPIAISGVIGFIVAGWSVPMRPEWSVGFVYLPALIGIGVTSVVFAQIGARFAHKLPAETLKKLFSILLVVVGVKLIVG